MPASQDAPSSAGGWWRPGWLLRAALALSFAVYARTVVFDFVFDDRIQITFNEWIQSLRYLPYYFVTQVKVVVLAAPQWAGNYYRPLFNVWLALNYSVFGAIPGWWHLSTVAAHVFVTWLVYRMAARLTGNQTTGALAALLFGVYPLHIEAVAWVSGVAEVQVAGGMILSFLAYLNWRDGKAHRGRWMAGSLVAFAAALLSKETAVVFPALVLVYESLNGQDAHHWLKRGWQGVQRALPFAAVLLLYFAARFYALRGLANPSYPRPRGWVLLTLPSVLWFYIRQLLWPFRISEFYDLDLQKQFSLRGVLLPAMLAVAAGWGIWMACRRSRTAKFLLAWLVIPMAPAIAGVAYFWPHDYVHDRYLYVPSVGFCILLALVGEWLAKKAGARMAQVIAAVLAIVLGVTTVVQVGQWDSDITLFSHAAKIAPGSPLPRDYLARSYLQINDNETGLRILRELLHDHPDYWTGNFNLGTADYELGHYAEAEQYLRRAIQTWQNEEAVRPDSRQYYYLGRTLMKLDRWPEAEAPLRQAITLRPDAVGYHAALAQVLRRQGREEEAQAEMALEERNRKALVEVERKFGLLR